jgi:hypothetical protein
MTTEEHSGFISEQTQRRHTRQIELLQCLNGRLGDDEDSLRRWYGSLAKDFAPSAQTIANWVKQADCIRTAIDPPRRSVLSDPSHPRLSDVR